MEWAATEDTSTLPRIEFLELFTGWNDDGADFWCYISVRRERYSEYKNLIAEGADIQLSEYGHILRQGAGMLPPPNVRKAISDQYGFDHAFEKKMI